MTFELEFLDGKRAVPRQLLSYRWSGDVTAGCDGLRLHFLWDGDLPEVYRVRAEHGKCIRERGGCRCPPDCPRYGP